MSISINDDENPEDLLWSAAAIAAVIRRSPRATFYMLESGIARCSQSQALVSQNAVEAFAVGTKRIADGWRSVNAVMVRRAFSPSGHRDGGRFKIGKEKSS